MKKNRQRLPSALWGFILGFLSAVGGGQQVFADGLNEVRGSLFKVRTVTQEPDYGSPWRLRSQSSGHGTGFYIGEGRILTNAHVVAHGRFITVEREGDSRQLTAAVQFIGHDCDLAILTVKDPRAFRGVKALDFGPLPKLHSPVITVGYPMGGDQISITQGVVSRLGFSAYSHPGDREHLLVQVDSAINPGNSGGPVLQNNEVVGVAFQAFAAAENTGYIIPTPIVKRFLTDVEDGRYDGHPEDGILVQPDALVNPAAMAFHGTQEGVGIKVVDVFSHVAPFGKIFPGDVLTAIDGNTIGLDGRISFQGEKLDYTVIYDLKQMNENVEFDVVRDGKSLKVAFDIVPSKKSFLRGNTYPKRPRYVIYGGLVFTGLSRNYLQSWGKAWFQKAPLLLRSIQRNVFYSERFKTNEDVVIISGRLAHSVNTYARDRETAVVDSLNGLPIKSMAQFYELMTKGTGDFIRLGLYERDDLIILPRQAAQKANEEINKSYGIDLPSYLPGIELDGAEREGA